MICSNTIAEEYINEFAELLPYDLEPYGKVGNHEIYSNSKIVEFIMHQLMESPECKPIAHTIKEGIENRVILIGFENRSKIKFLWHRWKSFLGMRNDSGTILGYFSRPHKKIVIVLDENTNLLGKSLMEIPPILNHELIHFTCETDVDKFLKTMMNHELFPYYRKLTTEFYPASKLIPDKNLISTIYQLGTSFYSTFEPILNAKIIWKEYFLNLRKFGKGSYTDKAVELMFVPFSKVFGGHIKPEYQEWVKSCFKAYYDSYKAIGIHHAQEITLACQEVISVSEISCIANEFKVKPELANLINSTDFGF